MYPGPQLPPQVDIYFRRDTIITTARVTVLFRLVLVLPHLIVLGAASIAAFVITVIAWFAALFTARVPAGLYEVLAWVIAYGTRVMAYLFFLTDRWPTFTERPDDPVLVRFPGPGRLNRAAVLFRLVLLIPVLFLAEFVNQGLTIVSVVAWVLLLAMGRMPQPLFDATASAVRYQTRYLAYAAMLTARYPGGLFGDVGEPTEPAPAGIEQPAAFPAMNRPAKRLVVTFIVLGVLAFVARTVISARDNSSQRARHAQAALSRSYASLNISDLQDCGGTTDELGCIRETAGQNAGEMRSFEDDLDGIDFPNDDLIASAVTQLRSATDLYITGLQDTSQAASLSSGPLEVLNQEATAVDLAVHQLEVDLANYAADHSH